MNGHEKKRFEDMKYKACLFLIGLLATTIWSYPPVVKSKKVPCGAPFCAGDPFPQITISGATSPEEKAYLGIRNSEALRVGSIKADLVIIELFSIYCTSCQRMAPEFNAIFDMIENDDQTRGRVKFIGICLGNNKTEVDFFRKKYSVKFPLFPDPKYKILDLLGETRSPLTIFVRQGPDIAPVVVGTHLGYDPEREKLFHEIERMLTQDIQMVRRMLDEREKLDVLSVVSEKELHSLIKEGAEELGGELASFTHLDLKDRKYVYAVSLKTSDKTRQLFAAVASCISTCDVCHDVHYVYYFDTHGMIVNLKGIQLAKDYNESFNSQDIKKMKNKLLGTYVYNPFTFDARVDAVTSATITSSLIIRCLNKSQGLFEMLKSAGYLNQPEDLQERGR